MWTYFLKRSCKFGEEKGKIKQKTNLQACKPMEFIHVVARWTTLRKVSSWARTKVRAERGKSYLIRHLPETFASSIISLSPSAISWLISISLPFSIRHGSWSNLVAPIVCISFWRPCMLPIHSRCPVESIHPIASSARKMIPSATGIHTEGSSTDQCKFPDRDLLIQEIQTVWMDRGVRRNPYIYLIPDPTFNQELLRAWILRAYLVSMFVSSSWLVSWIVII